MTVEIINIAQGETVFVPRIPLIPNAITFELERLQFRPKVCFAKMINKSQGQTLKIAGVQLRQDCFVHGQVYVACSRFELTPKPRYFATILQNGL